MGGAGYGPGGPPGQDRLSRAGDTGCQAPERLLSAFGRGLPGTPEEQGALLLSYGLFRTDDLHVPVDRSPAGQRRRLALARLLARPADLLLFDEPTNHPALGLVEELQEALADWTGRWWWCRTTGCCAAASA